MFHVFTIMQIYKTSNAYLLHKFQNVDVRKTTISSRSLQNELCSASCLSSRFFYQTLAMYWLLSLSSAASTQLLYYMRTLFHVVLISAEASLDLAGFLFASICGIYWRYHCSALSQFLESKESSQCSGTFNLSKVSADFLMEEQQGEGISFRLPWHSSSLSLQICCYHSIMLPSENLSVMLPSEKFYWSLLGSRICLKQQCVDLSDYDHQSASWNSRQLKEPPYYSLAYIGGWVLSCCIDMRRYCRSASDLSKPACEHRCTAREGGRQDLGKSDELLCPWNEVLTAWWQWNFKIIQSATEAR